MRFRAAGGPSCLQCGHKSERKSRVVVQANGDLKEVEGDIYKPRRIKELPDTEKIWRQCYMRAKNSKNGMTFRQAEGCFSTRTIITRRAICRSCRRMRRIGFGR
jgi:hypothetical protein